MGEEYKREIVVMGSVPSLGPVDLYDDMEGVFKWAGAGEGTDFVCEKYTTDAFNGSACLHLKTRTTDAAASDGVTGTRSFYQRPGKRYNMEMIWMPESQSSTAWVRLQFEIYDGSYGHRGGIICDVEGGRWYYIRLDGGTVEIPNSPVQPSAGAWHRMSYTFNESSGLYEKLIADGEVIDMSTLQYEKWALVTVAKGLIITGVSSVGATPPNLFIDDVLVLER